jgi:hypothetical protein
MTHESAARIAHVWAAAQIENVFRDSKYGMSPEMRDEVSMILLRLNARGAGEAAAPLIGETVWGPAEAKTLTLEMDNSRGVEAAYLGEADRPSEVARLLRAAADDVERAWLEATAGRD